MKWLTILILSVMGTLTVSSQSAPGPLPGNLLPCLATCTSPSNLNCTQNTIASFNDRQYVSGTGSGPDSVGAVWRFYNIATDNSVPGNPVQVNATITISVAYHAQVVVFDDNNATNQNGVLLPNLFAPTIQPDQNLTNSSRTGYVQFTMSFYRNVLAGTVNKYDIANYTTPISLTGLNYVHYDIDGESNSNYEFRETGLVKQVNSSNPVINANIPSEINAYNYTADGATWRGFVGSICSRSGTSDCAEAVASMLYSGAQQTLTFRMGYNYLFISGSGANSRPQRLYGATFGCFNFPQQGQLPLKLLSFDGNYNHQQANIEWETENEVNVSHFDLERSSNGTDFSVIARKASVGNETSRNRYQASDDLSGLTGNIFYYRLSMVDIDNRITKSPIIRISRSKVPVRTITISPNPILNNRVNVSFYSNSSSLVNILILDMSGKVINLPSVHVQAGNNTYSIPVTVKLQPGTYMLQLSNDEFMSKAKFTVIQ